MISATQKSLFGMSVHVALLSIRMGNKVLSVVSQRPCSKKPGVPVDLKREA